VSTGRVHCYLVVDLFYQRFRSDFWPELHQQICFLVSFFLNLNRKWSYEGYGRKGLKKCPEILKLRVIYGLNVYHVVRQMTTTLRPAQ
jgi:hypothetical protein